MNPRTKRRIALSGIVAGSITALAVGALYGRAWYRAHRIAEDRRMGLERFAAGDYRAALAPLSGAARDRDDLEVLLALADCRTKIPQPGLRHMRVASAMYASVEQQDPRNLRAMRGQLDCAVALGYLSDIPGIVERLLRVSPDDVGARAALLQTRAAQGRWSDAVATALELQGLEPTELRWRAAHIQCLAADGADADGRLGLIRRWRGENPAMQGLALLEADALRLSGRSPEAREVYGQLASQGASDAVTLMALLEGLEATGLSDRVEEAIAASALRIKNAEAIAEIEGERLLSAGRLADLGALLGRIGPQRPDERAAIARFRVAAAYLSGDDSAAREALRGASQAVIADSPFLRAADAALGVASSAGTAQAGAAPGGEREVVAARIERVAQELGLGADDPIIAAMLSDMLVDAGEFDVALAVLTRSFDAGGRRSQPLGLRGVRVAARLGRVPDALEFARDLGIRYRTDGAVATAILEAWAAALQSGYVPSRVYGALGTDSPDGLFSYWEELGRPMELGAMVAEVLARRGQAGRARAIVEEALGKAPDAAAALRLLPAARRLDEPLVRAVVARAAELPVSSAVAIELALELQASGMTDAAVSVLDAAASRSQDAETVRRLTRTKRAMSATGTEGTQWIEAEFDADPGAETASFVLSRPEVWSTVPADAARNAALVGRAIAAIRDEVGSESQRAVVAEATATLVFHAGDAPRVAASLAALARAERASPDSVPVLATFARLLEADSPPDPARAAALMTRAVQLQPGSYELYPDLVRLLQQTGDYEGASEAIDAYARISRTEIPNARTTARMREDQRQFDEAVTVREQIVGKTRERLDRLALVRTRVRAGQPGEAEADLRDLLAETRDPLVARELALLLARNGQLEEARQVLSEPDIVAPAAVRAELELTYGDLDRAKLAAREALVSQPGAAANLLLARVLLRSGELGEARGLLVDAIVRQPEDPAILPVAAAILVGDLTEGGRASLRAALDAARATRPDLVAAVELLDRSADADGSVAPDADDLRLARDLTVRYSGSALVWRLAVQIYAAAGQPEEAARLALIALSRLPNDEATAEMAVRSSIEAGRLEDAAAAAAAWRRMTGADELASDTARALVDLIGRNPRRAREVLLPHLREALATQSGDDALGILASATVLAGQSGQISAEMNALQGVRRSRLVVAWLQAATSVGGETGRRAALDALAFAGAFDPDASACVAALTLLCRAGDAEACSVARMRLGTLGDGGIPRRLLEADLAVATGAIDEAVPAYEALFGEELAAAGRSGLRASFDQLSEALASETALRGAFERNAAAIAAMNNLADAWISAKVEPARSTALASAVVAIVPESGEAWDTLARAHVAAGRPVEAAAAAARNPDRLLGAVGRGEAARAAGDIAEVRRALLEADAAAARTSLPQRSVGDRIAALRKAVEETDGRGGAT